MEDELVAALGELGAHLGLRLVSHITERNRKLNRTELADAVLESCVAQTTRIVQRLGITRQIQVRDFAFIVGAISAEHAGIIRLLANTEISVVTDCSHDIEDTCVRAWMNLRR